MTEYRAWLGAWAGRRSVRIGLTALLVLILAGALAGRIQSAAEARRPYTVPHNADMENRLGVRFERAAVVADGGIVEIRYTVLDSQKASRFQNDVHHPPLLRSERRKGDVYRAALMKQGHQLRPGQTYYILYLNNANTIRPGDTIEIDAGDAALVHVPVR